ncbi:MAG: methyltransferase domain-containing protein [Dehalococcoidia bacterium]
MLRSAARTTLDRAGLLEPARALVRLNQRLEGARTRRDDIAAYLQRAAAPRLHLGAGANTLPGWLNTDLVPSSRRVVYLDATKRFPFKDATFEAVFTEHLIEHVPFEAGRHMLAECRRVLRPGGHLRVATPDIEFLRRLLAPAPSEVERRYLEWATREFLPPGTPIDAALVVNHFARAWGHQLIYSAALLASTIEAAGFIEVTRHALGESADPTLRNLEHTTRMPEGFLALETMVFEARRPPLD